MDPTLVAYFKKHAIEYELFTHAAVFTVAESKNVKGTIPGASTKNLFLKDENGQFYLVCLPAEKRLNIKQLQEFFSCKKMVFCSPEELATELHVTPGSVSLFATVHAKATTLVLDQELWDADKVGFHPNQNTATCVLSHENLARFYDSLKIKKYILSLSS